jgi:hypothetical protein
METFDLTTDEALLESISEHHVEDLKLEPFSLLRQIISADLCDQGSGTLFNAVMTVWVCTLSPKEALAAHANLEKSKLDAFDWAEKRGYSLWNWKPIVKAYGQLNKEWIASTKANIESNDGEVVPNVGGQPV